MQQTASPETKMLSNLHLAMFLGQLLFSIISFSLVYSKKFFSPFLNEYLEMIFSVCVILGVTGYLAGNIFFKRRLEQIHRVYKPLPQRLNEYRSASIMRWALLEFAILLSIIFFMLTNAYEIITVAGGLMILFLSCRPTAQKIATDLRISEAELSKINKRIFF